MPPKDVVAEMASGQAAWRLGHAVRDEILKSPPEAVTKAACAQGWMVGSYITGLQHSPLSLLFSLLTALTLPALYLVLGCGWLLIKTEGTLLARAIGWARTAIWPMGLGLLVVSIATPIVSQTIADKWFSLPNFLLLAPIPLICALCYLGLLYLLRQDEILQGSLEEVRVG